MYIQERDQLSGHAKNVLCLVKELLLSKHNKLQTNRLLSS